MPRSETQLTGPPCPEELLVAPQDDALLQRIPCRLGQGHPVSIHTGEHVRQDGSRLVVSWGEG